MLKRLILFGLLGAVCFLQAEVSISLKSLPQSQVLFGGFRNADHFNMKAYTLSITNDTDKEIEIFPKDFDVSLMQAEDIFSLHFPQYHIWKFFTAVMASYFSYLGSIPFAIFSITDYADSRKLSRESQNIDKIAKLRQLAEIEKIYHRDKMLLDISGHVMFAQQNEYINYDDFYNAGLVHIENKKQRLINEVTAKDWWVVKVIRIEHRDYLKNAKGIVNGLRACLPLVLALHGQHINSIKGANKFLGKIMKNKDLLKMVYD